MRWNLLTYQICSTVCYTFAYTLSVFHSDRFHIMNNWRRILDDVIFFNVSRAVWMSCKRKFISSENCNFAEQYARIVCLYCLLWNEGPFTDQRPKWPRGRRRARWFGFISNQAWSPLCMEVAEKLGVYRYLMICWPRRSREWVGVDNARMTPWLSKDYFSGNRLFCHSDVNVYFWK